MGVDSRLWFPPETRVRDVATALSILLGGKPSRHEFTQGEGWACEVDQALKVENSNVPEMLIISGEVDGKRVWNTWHWEGGGPAGYRLMMCHSDSGRYPALRKLADFFGGILDEADCDDNNADFTGSLRNKAYRTDADDGIGWDAFQQALLDLGDDPERPYDWPF